MSSRKCLQGDEGFYDSAAAAADDDDDDEDDDDEYHAMKEMRCR